MHPRQRAVLAVTTALSSIAATATLAVLPAGATPPGAMAARRPAASTAAALVGLAAGVPAESAAPAQLALADAAPTGWVAETYPGSVPTAVACAPASTFCVVSDNGGGVEVTTDGSTWTGYTVPISPTNQDPTSLACPSTSDCWLIGDQQVAASTNGGKAWAVQSPSAWKSDSWQLRGIACPSTSVCFAAGGVYNGSTPVIARLSGGTWSLLTVPAGHYELNAISCATVDDCVAVGGTGAASGALAFVTTDGGARWKVVTASPLSTLWPLADVSCTTAADCWAVGLYPGGPGAVVVSTDGGLRWGTQAIGSEQGTPTGIDCAGKAFASTDCWTVMDNANTDDVQATVDGGQVWFGQKMPTSIGWTGTVSCASATDCWATSAEEVWRTTDGGGVAANTSRTAVVSEPSRPIVGQPTFLVATVTGGGGRPGGSVTFSAGGVPLSFCSSVPLTAVTSDSSAAICALYFTEPVATTFGASWPGDGIHSGSAALTRVDAHEPGYRFVASDGGIFSFGGLRFEGSVPGVNVTTESVVGMATDDATGGYWVVTADGGVFSFGARFAGSQAGRTTGPLVAVAGTLDGNGYWIVGADGNVYAFGDAHDFGRVVGVPASTPIVGMQVTPDDGGYWLVQSDGAVYAFGDAGKYGDLLSDHVVASDVVGMAAQADGTGYWLIGRDGGIFTFGGAKYLGSEGGVHLTKPIVGMAADPATGGYWQVGGDGGIFAFRARYLGSTGGIRLNLPIVGMAAG